VRLDRPKPELWSWF